ncbi:hypothetical protein Anas_07446, partial [Armadillidium nasatum]
FFAVGIETVVCKLKYIFRVTFSVFALLWNYLAAFALTSICRSHVIRIRKFMKILEQDSICYEAKFLGLSTGNENANNTSTPLEEYTWVDEDYLNELDDNEESLLFEGRKLSSRNQDGSNVDIPDQPSTSTIGITTETSQTDLRISSVALAKMDDFSDIIGSNMADHESCVVA